MATVKVYDQNKQESGDITLKDLAGVIAEYAGTKVVFELPDDTEKSGYSTATKARLDGSKLRALGWQTKYDMHTGVFNTVNILKKNVMDRENR